MRTRRGFVALALSLTLLVGCTPGSLRSPSPSGSPAPTEGDAPSTDSALEPASRIPLSCDELVPRAVAAAFLGVSEAELTLRNDRDAEFTTAIVQGGAISCWWHGPPLGDDGEVVLTVEVLADAFAEFDRRAVSPRPESDVDTIGGGSVVTCNDSKGYFFCDMSFVVRQSYWVEVGVSGLGAVGGSRGGTVFGSALASRLNTAGPPLAAFVPPADALGLGSSCGAIDGGGAFRAALSSPGLSAPLGDDASHMLFVTAVGIHAGRLGCVWGTPYPATPAPGAVQQIALALTPGGSWNWASVAAEAIESGAVPIEVPGATSALAHKETDTCWLVVDIEHSLIQVIAVHPDAPAGDPCITAVKIVELISATG